jgi:hypothetical protein
MYTLCEPLFVTSSVLDPNILVNILFWNNTIFVFRRGLQSRCHLHRWRLCTLRCISFYRTWDDGFQLNVSKYCPNWMCSILRKMNRKTTPHRVACVSCLLVNLTPPSERFKLLWHWMKGWLPITNRNSRARKWIHPIIMCLNEQPKTMKILIRYNRTKNQILDLPDIERGW